MHGGAFDFPFCVARFQVLPFVELSFSFSDGEADLHFSVLPIEREREEGVAFDGGEVGNFSDFGLVKEKLPGGFWAVILLIPEVVFVDVSVVKPDFVVFDPGKGITDLAASCAEGFDLGAAENDTGFERLEDVVIAPGLWIVQDIGHC